MKKILLTLIALMIGSVTVACSVNEYTVLPSEVIADNYVFPLKILVGDDDQVAVISFGKNDSRYVVRLKTLENGYHPVRMTGDHSAIWKKADGTFVMGYYEDGKYTNKYEAYFAGGTDSFTSKPIPSQQCLLDKQGVEMCGTPLQYNVKMRIRSTLSSTSLTTH